MTTHTASPTGTLERSFARTVVTELGRFGWNASAIWDRATSSPRRYLIYVNRPEERSDCHMLCTVDDVARFMTTRAVR